MVYGAALEKRWVAMPRGFESHPLRQMVKAKFGSPANFRRKIEFFVFSFAKQNSQKQASLIFNLVE